MTKKLTSDKNPSALSNKESISRMIALIGFLSLNVMAIFSDEIINQIKSNIQEKPAILEVQEKKKQIIEVQQVVKSIKSEELIQLQEKYQELSAKYDNLDDKISKMQNHQNSSKIILTYFDLLKKIQNGENYQNELLITKLLINKESELYQYFLELENLLKNNIKTNKEIINNFDKIISELITHYRQNDDDTLISKIKNNILSHITIRKIKFEEQDETKINYLIYEIERDLKSEDYQEALYFLNKINKTAIELTSEIKEDLQNLIRFQDINQNILQLLQ
jgi:hypothetical protein